MKNWALLLIAVLSLGTMQTAYGAGYLKFDGIEGESLYQQERGWIEVLSFSHGMSRDPRAGRGNARGARRGRVNVEDLSFVKELDKSSTKLAESLADGLVIPKVEFHLTTPGGNRNGEAPVTYYVYELKNVQVVSYSVGGDQGLDLVPIDSFSLNFEEIKVTYLPIKDVGAEPTEFVTNK